MEPLYVTETAYTLEEYEKYNKSLTGKKLLVMFLILLLYIVLLCLLTKTTIWLIIGVLIIAVVGITFPIKNLGEYEVCTEIYLICIK